MTEYADKNLAMARRIAQAAAAAGGRAYFVGGLVRDHILGRENKDVDLEIHGIPPEKLVQLLRPLGQVIKNGVSFGVFGLRSYEIDIAMPRKEADSGRGSRDFEDSVDPFLGCERAARRRDFTMNALMEDVLTGEVLDFFGGRADLRAGVIRHVDPVTFREDPLRVLRAAQFAARFGFRAAEETTALASSLDLKDLAPERILGEVSKALMKAPRPSVFFEELRRMDQLSLWFPETEALIGVPQDPAHHPEGDVWIHTMMVLDEAAALRSRAEYPEGFLFSALAHDFGKSVSTTREGDRIRALRHEKTGVALARRFLRRISKETRLERYVLNMVALHMKPNMEAAAKSSVKATMHMLDEALCPADLLLLARADHFGKGEPGSYEEAEAFLRDRLALYRERMALPFVQGRDLIEAGARPGPDFTETLVFAHKLRLAGVPKDDALTQSLAYLRRLRSEK